jgi:N-acetyldiaminopimelate deacetylase
LVNEEALTTEFMEFTSTNTDFNVKECKEAMTGEDFGYMVDQCPGFMFWLGVDSTYGLHHAKLEPNESAINVAVELMSKYIEYKANQK